MGAETNVRGRQLVLMRTRWFLLYLLLLSFYPAEQNTSCRFSLSCKIKKSKVIAIHLIMNYWSYINERQYVAFFKVWFCWWVSPFLLQKSVHLIKQIIASEWIQPQGLKYISASLYSVGLLLYRNKQVNEVISYGCDF